ncbi:MAG TPA: ABC transporter substrate-binding protein [Myxococcaceae bacterium]|nr:ABC transporter substrate-binding protein [Myxococcaceae bacterium]
MRSFKWAVVALAAVAVAGCSRRKANEGPLVLGYFPNITHAQAIVGMRDGTFERELKGRPLRTRTFNAGPAAMEALMAGELDVAYVGPGPAIVAHIRSGGRVKVIAGAASGGAGLVVRGISGLDGLAGEKIAVPQIGNTQDIALRFWLKGQGKSAAQVTPLDNPEIVNLFRQGLLKAAWVPEPWAATLISEGATLLVDERTLWPGGRFPTTVMVATDQALKNRREEVKAVLRAHLQLTARARKDPAAFTRAVNDGFESLTKKRLKDEVMTSAFGRLELVTDPMQDQLRVEAEHAAALGYVPKADASHLVDPSLLRELGAEQGVGGSGPGR